MSTRDSLIIYLVMWMERYLTLWVILYCRCSPGPLVNMSFVEVKYNSTTRLGDHLQGHKLGGRGKTGRVHHIGVVIARTNYTMVVMKTFKYKSHV